MKKYALLICFFSLLLIPNLSFAAEVKIIGTLGQGKELNHDTEEMQKHSVEESTSTIIKDTDKSLPKAGGILPIMSVLVGTISSILGLLLYAVKARGSKT